MILKSVKVPPLKYYASIILITYCICIKVLESLIQISGTNEGVDFSPFPSQTTALLFMLLHMVNANNPLLYMIVQQLYLLQSESVIGNFR